MFRSLACSPKTVLIINKKELSALTNNPEIRVCLGTVCGETEPVFFSKPFSGLVFFHGCL